MIFFIDMARTKASEQQRLIRARTKADVIDESRRYWLAYRSYKLHLQQLRRQIEQQRLKNLDQYGQIYHIPTLMDASVVPSTTL